MMYKINISYLTIRLIYQQLYFYINIKDLCNYKLICDFYRLPRERGTNERKEIIITNKIIIYGGGQNHPMIMR